MQTSNSWEEGVQICTEETSMTSALWQICKGWRHWRQSVLQWEGLLRTLHVCQEGSNVDAKTNFALPPDCFTKTNKFLSSCRYDKIVLHGGLARILRIKGHDLHVDETWTGRKKKQESSIKNSAVKIFKPNVVDEMDPHFSIHRHRAPGSQRSHRKDPSPVHSLGRDIPPETGGTDTVWLSASSPGPAATSPPEGLQLEASKPTLTLSFCPILTENFSNAPFASIVPNTSLKFFFLCGGRPFTYVWAWKTNKGSVLFIMIMEIISYIRALTGDE